MPKLKTKLPSASVTVKTEVVCPNDTNPMGMLQGGQLVHWMDIAAAVCAQVHAEKICVTYRRKLQEHSCRRWRYGLGLGLKM